MLTYLDPAKPFILDTDASNEAAGAVLSQMVDSKERVVAYYSNAFTSPSSSQQNYCMTREIIAVVLAVNHLRPYFFVKRSLG